MLSGLISAAIKVKVTSCLIQKSASCLCLIAHAASFGCVRSSTQNHEWLLLKLGSMNTLCLIQATSLCFPKNSPYPSSTGDARQQQQKAGKNFTRKEHHCKRCAEQSPQNAGWIYLFFFQVYQTDHHFLEPRDIRTSSTCTILLNFLSWLLTSSWMHHVSRHKTVPETAYKVLLSIPVGIMRYIRKYCFSFIGFYSGYKQQLKCVGKRGKKKGFSDKTGVNKCICSLEAGIWYFCSCWNLLALWDENFHAESSLRK